MSISAIIPVEFLASANAALEELGHGRGNFSVPLRTGTADATHVGLHAWNDAVFLASLQSIPNVIISTDGEGAELFAAHTTAQLLEWSDPTNWHQNPVMIGATRTHGGKTWESLVDYNVWTPPINWREVPAVGQLPDWVQPTGAGDVWNLGDEVNHASKQWRSLIANNVWEPGAVGSERLWEEIRVEEPEEPGVIEWAPGQVVKIGDKRTYQGITYTCRQSHTTQAGWTPPVVPALWLRD